jgi:hypothetical protein
MELIDRIDRRPVFITFGKRGGSTAAPSVLRDAGRIAAAGRPEDAGLTGCTTGFEIGSANLARESVVPVPAPVPAPTGAVS